MNDHITRAPELLEMLEAHGVWKPATHGVNHTHGAIVALRAGLARGLVVDAVVDRDDLVGIYVIWNEDGEEAYNVNGHFMRPVSVFSTEHRAEAERMCDLTNTMARLWGTLEREIA